VPLIGPRPRNAFALPPPTRPAVKMPPLTHLCPGCDATLRSAVDWQLHNCFTRYDQMGDRHTRNAL
jgi:hypothetical protein